MSTELPIQTKIEIQKQLILEGQIAEYKIIEVGNAFTAVGLVKRAEDKAAELVTQKAVREVWEKRLEALEKQLAELAQ